MKKLIVALLVGLAMGYNLGYDEGWEGRPSVFSRTLDRFGKSKIAAAQENKERRMQEASRP